MTRTNGGNKALHVATNSGWYRFEKEGDRWQQADRALTFWSLSCLAVDPEDPHTVYAGTEHSGLFYSHDAGATWKRADPNVPHLCLFSLLALPGSVLVGTRPAALYHGSPGTEWEEFEGVRAGGAGGTFPPNPEQAARTRHLATDPRSPQRLYAGIEVGGLLVSDDSGQAWKTANEGMWDPDVHQVRPSRANPELVIAACGEGIFRSLNRAAKWEEITPAGSRTYGTAITEAADGTAYLGIALGRPNTWIRKERASSAILRSPHDGADWSVVAEGFRGGIMDAVPDPDGEGIFAATSEGDILTIEGSHCRTIAGGLPCISAIAFGG